ncbi:hypothetical protein LOTGIDRAFT_235640 [Lottia gigantea]|uniref:CARD domain-containing protein n=1 Tax=Lottia gigantea TaxID=225164 RepID=V4BAR8_LOTGI|nr:hypothetical protein LOTGIDRAFT_235640 [Lottia gigantea]ESO86064.1 hypothetical protein LOTGIDRAFT_235640 [Lottia gigantea]
MDQRRQATILNYSMAIEDSVVFDKIWYQMEPIFTEDEKLSIQGAGGNKKKTRMMLEILPMKDDNAFDTLVMALKPDYRWLAFRIEQGVHEEEDRLTRAGKGIKRKVTVALMQTRISDRQRDIVIDSVSDVIEDELRDRTLRVDIPDHEAAANLNELNHRLRNLVNERIDPLLHGPRVKTDLSKAENQVLADRMEQMLNELQAIENCYQSMEVDTISASPRSLPVLLYQKIDEVKTQIDILEEQQEQYRLERDEILREKNEKGQTLSELESQNNNLEFENRKLREEVLTLESSCHDLNIDKRNLTNERRRIEEDHLRILNQQEKREDEAMFHQTRNKRLEEINGKLSRDVQRLTNSNMKLRNESRRSSAGDSARLRGDKKRLLDEKSRLQTEVRRQENEKRIVLVRNQRLEAENQNLKEQKRRLYEEKVRFQSENQSLKSDAKRLALGRYEQDPRSREYRNASVNHTRRSRSVEVESSALERSAGSRRGSMRKAATSTGTPKGNARPLPSQFRNKSITHSNTSGRMFKSYPASGGPDPGRYDGKQNSKQQNAKQQNSKQPSPPKDAKPVNYNKNARKSVTFRG